MRWRKGEREREGEEIVREGEKERGREGERERRRVREQGGDTASPPHPCLALSLILLNKRLFQTDR